MSNTSPTAAPGRLARWLDSDVWHSFITSPMAMLALSASTALRSAAPAACSAACTADTAAATCSSAAFRDFLASMKANSATEYEMRLGFTSGPPPA